MTTTIDAVIYSYKNKFLKEVVDNLIASTSSDIHIYLYDQHPLDRKDVFDSPQISYNHIFWDHLNSPCEYKSKTIHESSSEYFLVLSDDILVKEGWDDILIDFIKDNKTIVSGVGKQYFKNRDLFTIISESQESDNFSETNIISKNLIFSKTSTLKPVSYPIYVKYLGEDELLSFRCFEKGYTVYNAPSSLGSDLGQRTLENKYKTFSIEHKYGKVLDIVSDSFWRHVGLDGCPILPLPYANDDVPYNPNSLKINDIDSRKFISNVKSIH
jgi:hypothetical protein